MTESNVDMITKDTVANQNLAISSIQNQSAIYIYKLEHAGDKTVAKDILEYAVMTLDALEENPVDTCISLTCVITVMNSHKKSIIASSAQKTFAIIAQLRKPILKTFTT